MCKISFRVLFRQVVEYFKRKYVSMEEVIVLCVSDVEEGT